MFTEETVLALIEKGEDAFTQFKVQVDRSDSLAREMVAFANCEGGNIIIGVTDDKSIVGVHDIGALNQLISNASSQNCVPPIHTITQNLNIDQKLIVIISVPQGIQKPYHTSKPVEYLIKSGADKRQMSTQELQRMVLQSAGISTEELPIHNTDIEQDLNMPALYLYFEKEYGESITQFIKNNNIDFIQLVNNLGIVDENKLNLNGLLFFGKSPQRYRPLFVVKAVHFVGNDIAETEYVSNADFEGTLDIQFTNTKNFILSNLPRKQNGQSFNSIGIPEISEIAIEEAVINALVHRDYGILSPIRVLIFQNRLEIISPGHLVNHLTVDKIKLGGTNARNPQMLRFASRILPYRGLGSGILRILKAHPNTDFINDRDGHQFKVVMWRD
jgi:ATP-dependent DNA helicase RecG